MGGGGNGQSFINNIAPATGGGGGNGAQGVQGPQGTNPGPQGAQGNQGSLGSQGNQGNTGTGTQGNQGNQGPSGAGGGGLWQNPQENTLTTADATPTTILSEAIVAGEVATFRVIVDARYNDGSQHASFVRTIRVNREGGGAVLGIENADYTDDSSAALLAGFNVSGNNLIVEVTGVAATNITWKARMARIALP